MAIPDGAACYFCLEEKGDDEGHWYATAHVVAIPQASPILIASSRTLNKNAGLQII
jgi:hypothetical protein